MRGICTEKIFNRDQENPVFLPNLAYGQTDGYTEISSYKVASLLKTDLKLKDSLKKRIKSFYFRYSEEICGKRNHVK